MFSMVTDTVFRKRHPKVGARPGTLAIEADAPRPIVRLINYTKEKVEEHEVSDLSELAIAHEVGSVAWIDVQGFGDESVIREIGKTFELHPLAMEDVVNVPQRPKCEAYGDQLLIIVRMVTTDGSFDVTLEQVAIVVGKTYVLTFQERHGDVLDPVRKRIRLDSSRLRHSGSDYLAYVILDTIVDAYYPVLESLGEHLENMETLVIESPSPEVLRLLHRTKNTLISLRRAIWPQREAVNSLIRDKNALIGEEVQLFLRDSYDHCVQTAEVAEMYREMVTGLMNTYLSSVANRTNDVMKTLTIMASIFIPLTFLAGIYGMNFEHMPELHYRWSYPLVWSTMIAVVVVMLIYFHRKGWIGNSTTDLDIR